ncbi:MAG: FixH family protein [Planctomycetales bacterium]|nr:FixH family protein [Planctomycetales bacterium]
MNTLSVTGEISLQPTNEPKPESAEALAIAERKARRFWVTLIVGLLGLQVLIGIGTVYIAVGDPSMAVVPNYHQSALDWDVTRRSRQLTDRLGWSVNSLVGPIESGQRTLEVSIVDRHGQPVEKLNLFAQVYHHARGAKVYQLSMQEAQPGVYATRTELTQAGTWQLQVQMEGDEGIASISREIEVADF